MKNTMTVYNKKALRNHSLPNYDMRYTPLKVLYLYTIAQV